MPKEHKKTQDAHSPSKVQKEILSILQHAEPERRLIEKLNREPDFLLQIINALKDKKFRSVEIAFATNMRVSSLQQLEKQEMLNAANGIKLLQFYAKVFVED